eukprot:GHVU01232482.1.p1 GENE.GHVU01232482.1~~GHVU01232482.1.p1  ORF type:complete len:118 (-),score=6.91 GHVU01232482.1:474-827(-)
MMVSLCRTQAVAFIHSLYVFIHHSSSKPKHSPACTSRVIPAQTTTKFSVPAWAHTHTHACIREAAPLQSKPFGPLDMVRLYIMMVVTRAPRGTRSEPATNFSVSRPASIHYPIKAED